MSPLAHAGTRPHEAGASDLAAIAARLRGETPAPQGDPRATGPLRRPAGRQGPGNLPVGRLAAMDLKLRQRTAQPLPGEHLAVGTGAGVELAQLRAYVPGDDVRAIDAAATARTGIPHVRTHVPERSVSTWILLDVSPGMAFGTADRLKADVAEGVVTAIARIATRRGNRVGMVTCGASVERLLPPRGGRGAQTQIHRALAEGVAVDGAGGPGLEAGLRRISGMARSHSLVVLVSDFHDDPAGWARPLGHLHARHDVLAVQVADPRDEELPDVGGIWLTDPRTGHQLQVNTSSRKLRARYARAAQERQAGIEAALKRAGARHTVCSTRGDWFEGLARVLR